ncbi:MAG: CRISPR-associated RAMP protein [Acidobacteria bacterium]|nr:CRISPR-associated RAMP protein [Acidobacteriota bacterium]
MGKKGFVRRIKIKGDIEFETAFHVGSGKEGDLASDMGVLLDRRGEPILPGSSLKGNFRSTAERLAPHLKLTACLLDGSLSGVSCVTDESYRKGVHEEFKNLGSEAEKLKWLQRHTCDVCMLFGSPYQGSHIYFSDGALKEWGKSIQVRDGVCIDRDSHTAVHGAKYDYEVVGPGAQYTIQIELEDPTDEDVALVAAVVAEWEVGCRIGGFTSRGLGRAKLKDVAVSTVDYGNAEHLRAYLIDRKMQETPALLNEALRRVLDARGDGSA